MKIAVITGLFAKGDMDIYSCDDFLFKINKLLFLKKAPVLTGITNKRFNKNQINQFS